MDPTSILLASIARSSSETSLAEILIILVGSGGAAGIIATFFRMPSDRRSAAVTQAQTAMETMNMLNENLKQALAAAEAEAKRQRDRADYYRDQMEDIRNASEVRRRQLNLHSDDDESQNGG